MYSVNQCCIKRLLAVVFLLTPIIIATSTLGQLQGVSSYYVQTTDYGTDNIYFYSNQSLVELSAQHSSGASSSFVWSALSGSAWNEIKSESATVSSLSNVGEGCYRVVVSDGNSSEVYHCWLFFPEISDAVLSVVESTCDNVSLKVVYQTKALNYTNPANGSSYSVDYLLSFKWENSKEVLQVTETPAVVVDAPYSDEVYKVTISSPLSNSAEVSNNANVTAIAVKAIFTFENTKDKADNEVHTETEGSAPMRVTFDGAPDGTEEQSLGTIVNYAWTFGDAGKDYVPAPTFVFLEAGTYSVTLTVSNSTCSSTSEAKTFVVKAATLEVPNVFTPNGDGVNDEFRVAYTSIKKFNMMIKNRWGRTVYQSSDPSEGWDGRVGGKLSAPGVYFYEVSATGYNENETFHLTGFLHLLVGER